MINRRDKLTKHVLKAAVNYAVNKKFKSAARLMFAYGIDELTIERILYEPHNVRSSDYESTLHLRNKSRLH